MRQTGPDLTIKQNTQNKLTKHVENDHIGVHLKIQT